MTGPAGSEGADMLALIERLYPVCRSLTGDGVRETLSTLGEWIDLAVHEVPTGEQVFDWTVPREWNIRDAWVAGPDGKRVIDFRESNLHVVGYSVPVRDQMTLEQLRPHLHTLPEHPDWIPYRTTYYTESWGFCLSHSVLETLEEGEYEVCIDSSLADGYLTYGELYLPGSEEDEILVHTHVCHPSMCNDNLSGIAVATHLARRLADRPRRHSFRFLFLPGTIGAITWLARNEASLSRIVAGLVLANAGDPGRLTYKRSRRGDARVDRAASNVISTWPGGGELVDFSPFGYDERQYCSPGIDLPVGCLSRSRHGTYAEYHTSADNLELVRADCLQDTLDACDQIVEVLEADRAYRNLNPKCEPQLGRRGLYGSLGGAPGGRERELALLWVLNLSDGSHSLLDIAERSSMAFGDIREAAESLYRAGLLAELQDSRTEAST